MIYNRKYGNIWHDSSLNKITIEYNEIVLEIETDICIKKIVFKDYIAFEYIGQWDENIIKSIYEGRDDILIKKALEGIKARNKLNYLGGGVRDINSDWKCVTIQLIDDTCIRIVCKDIYGI